MTTRQSFVDALRDALNHLYDFGSLAKSPLIPLLGLGGADVPGAALFEAIEKAVEALRPAPERPLDSREQRSYRILQHRYIEGLTQADTAKRLSLTDRHVRRGQATAIEALAGYLRRRYAIAQDAPARMAERQGDDHKEDVAREMLWLADSLGEQTCDLESIVRESLQIAGALAQEQGVTLAFEIVGNLSRVAIPATVLKQVLLNLLTSAVCNIREPEMLIIARAAGAQMAVDLVGRGAVWDEEELAISRQLLGAFHGQLVLRREGDAVVPRILVDRAGRVVILAVEDNADTLQLWRRFLRDTRFHLEGLSEPERALERAIDLSVDLILLDVMMPEVDGWGLLRQLRQHPQTAHIPVVICTVLPQEQLARSLGASGFIRKPIKGREFRAQLERQIEALEHR